MKEKLNSMSEALDRTGIELDGIINSLTRGDRPEPYVPTGYPLALRFYSTEDLAYIDTIVVINSDMTYTMGEGGEFHWCSIEKNSEWVTVILEGDTEFGTDFNDQTFEIDQAPFDSRYKAEWVDPSRIPVIPTAQEK